MRILMISDVYFPRVNGVSTSIRTFRRELLALGHHVTLIAPFFPGHTEQDADILRIPSRGVPLDQAGKSEKKQFKPVAPGSYTSAAIILLTDGQRTTGPDSIDAARMAADRGVRIFTVGFGTKAGETIGFEGWSMRVRLDEETLKTIANLTRGEYFYAGTAMDLRKVYETLNSKFLLEKKQMEISSLFAAAAALVALVSGLLSLLWFNRVL